MGLIEFSFCAAAEREIVSDANEKSSYINLRSTNSLRNIIILHDLGWLPLCRVSILVWIFLLLAVHHLWRRMFPLLLEVLFRPVFPVRSLWFHDVSSQRHDM